MGDDIAIENKLLKIDIFDGRTFSEVLPSSVIDSLFNVKSIPFHSKTWIQLSELLFLWTTMSSKTLSLFRSANFASIISPPASGS